MQLEQYIKEKYEGKFTQFVTEEVKSVPQQNHVREIVNIKEYLGENRHAIKQRPNEVFNGVTLNTEKINLNYAKTIIKFSVNFLLSNPVSLSGSENVIDQLNKVYKKGKFHKVDYRILNDLIRYGEAFEYVYVSDNSIKSHVIDPSESFPVHDETNTMIAFIQAYNYDGIDYYNVFTEDRVYKMDNYGGDLRLVRENVNLTGLPIHYKTENEVDKTRGYAEINDYIDILDSMESLLSKSFDGYYRHIMGTPVVTGQQLTDAKLPKHGNGVGLTLDIDSTFGYVTNPFSHEAFKELYNTLKMALFDIAQMPNVVMNGGAEISNVSEVAVENLFTLSLVKANMNSKFLQDGFEVRLSKIRSILDMQGTMFHDDEYDSVRFVFSPSMPKSDKDIIESIEKLHEMGAISIESIMDNVSFIDKVQEQERVKDEQANTSNQGVQ